MFLQRILLPLAFATALFSACKQEDDEPPVTVTSEVRVDGVSNVEIERNSTAYLGLAVTSLNSQPNTALSISGLPTGVTGVFDVNNVPTPFTPILTLTASSAAVAGSSSTATITATPSGGTAKNYNFTVTVKASCVDALVGTYNVVAQCSNTGNSAYQSTISLDPGVANRIRISNFNNSGVTAFAEVDCLSGTVNMPQQSPTGASFAVGGSGSFTSNVLTISYNTSPLGGGFSESCGVTYTR